jgi:hypothetical protein
MPSYANRTFVLLKDPWCFLQKFQTLTQPPKFRPYWKNTYLSDKINFKIWQKCDGHTKPHSTTLDPSSLANV